MGARRHGTSNGVTLSALIAQTRAVVDPLGYSSSTREQHEYVWRQLLTHFADHGTIIFATGLAEQYVQEIRQQYESDAIKPWKFRLVRKAVTLVVQCRATYLGGVS